MERLTEEKQIGPFAALKDKAEAVPGAFGSYDCLYAHMVAVTRLKQYEDTGLEPEGVRLVAEMLAGDPYVPILQVSNLVKAYREGRTEILPPNDPLTLDELREMDGDPVWICDPDGSDGMWALVDLEYELCRTAKGGIAIFDTYGKTWLAYRRKPEEVE